MDEHSPSENVAVNLRAAREARGWSQATLVAELQRWRWDALNQTAISRIEKGERQPGIDDVSMLAKVLDVPQGRLAGPPDEFADYLRYSAALGGIRSAQQRVLEAVDEEKEARRRGARLLSAWGGHWPLDDASRRRLDRAVFEETSYPVRIPRGEHPEAP